MEYGFVQAPRIVADIEGSISLLWVCKTRIIVCQYCFLHNYSEVNHLLQFSLFFALDSIGTLHLHVRQVLHLA